MKINKIIAGFIYTFLFTSGASGLIYEIVWTRMLLLALGATMTSVVLVTVTFMAGLALGSFIFGRISDKVKNVLTLYAFLELGIGLTAVATPFLSGQAMNLYQQLFWLMNSNQILLFVKLLVSGLVIFLPAFIMGGTVPVAVKFFRTNFADTLGKDLGKIYAINTAGAVIGTLLAAYVLIEQVGLSNSIYFAVLLNITIGLAILILSRMWQPGTAKNPEIAVSSIERKSLYQEKSTLIFLAVAVSGFCGMAYEIVWTRLLTPITGTYIYAFAFILVLVLSGLAIGGFLYQRFLSGNFKVKLVLGLVEMGIGLGAFASLLVLSLVFPSSVLIMEVIVILPAAILMGMSFPIAANLCRDEAESGKFVGKLYTINTIGSLLGPITAAFILIPAFGSGSSILVIVGLNLFIGLCLLLTSGEESWKIVKIGATGVCAGIVVFVSGLNFFKPDFFNPKSLKHQLRGLKQDGIAYKYLEDNTASVLAYSGKDNYGLQIDGVTITVLASETKLMAHIPLLIHPEAKNLLGICLGMGTTFRSVLSYGINVDYVELDPSVPKVFPMFFADGKEVRQNSKGKIFVNDGRNYVFLTKQKYDVITLDPPPPLNSAGTTVLYSREFYRQSKQILNEDGLFVQWLLFGTREDDFKMLIQSFVQEFPYVKAFRSPSNMGLFLVGSEREINLDRSLMDEKLIKNPQAHKDLNEWQKFDAQSLIDLFFMDRSRLVKFAGNSPAVTDDRPMTEYFLLRHQKITRSISIKSFDNIK